MTNLRWLRIPAELRARRQWAVASLQPKQDGKLDKAPRNPTTGRMIDSTNPADWSSFEDAVNSGYPAIGYVLSADDPFTVIDLDDTTERQIKVYGAFPSYAERSVGGRGCHIILRGVMGGGRNRDKVEVYDRERFVICTGDVVRDAPVVDCQAMLDQLVSEMPSVDPDAFLHEGPEVMTDAALMERALAAKNGKKFRDLFYNTPAPGDDWSARDAALAQMLAFYTKSPTQALRLFRQSALYRPTTKGKDLEHYENYYLRRTFAKAYTYAREHDADIALGAEMARRVLDKPLTRVNGAATFPPGLIGDIAEYIYNAASRPVPEIALAGAITFFSGVVGRQFNISGTGLNMYTVLIAPTGRGKEGAASGIDGLISACRDKMPIIDTFRGPGHIASGQALIRTLDEQPVMFSILSEFGHLMKIVTDDRASASDVRTRQVLLDLFSKSGKHQSLQSSAYADKERNTKVVQAPCFAFLGDTTPERFYEILDNERIEEGFFPRLLTITYEGPRVPANKQIRMSPDPDLVDRLGALVTSIANMMHGRVFHDVAISAEAQTILDDFDNECDEKINTEGGTNAELWNRAHLKTLRLAALAAIGRNHFEPQVSVEDTGWALDMVRKDIASVTSRLASGNVGKASETKQLPAVTEAVHDYLKMDEAKRRSYRVPKSLLSTHYIPYTFFRRRFGMNTTFTKDRRGLAAAVKAALQDAVELGILQEVSIEQKQAIPTGGRSLDLRTPLYVLGENFD